MARSINKGPKPAGGYAKVSSKSLKDAKEKSAKRLAPRPEHPGLGKTARIKAKPVSVYGDAVNSLQVALLGAQKHGIDKLDARMLLLHALGKHPSDAAWLMAHNQDALNPVQAAAFGTACTRRRAGEPVAYITGQREFYGMDLAVDARVLVPRPDTETLVEWALERLAGKTAPKVLDLGTGSGAIALAIQKTRPDAQVTAVDFSADALAVAQANAAKLALPIAFVHSNWLAQVPGQYQLIVSNPPYIADADSHLPALAHEPLSALTSGADGLDDIRQIVSQAPAHLQAGGWLLLEHGYDQAAAVRVLLEQAGFGQVQSRQDLAGIERCSGGQMP
ncbi:peptide chain release factor N(5)-glutamine methyltransferase [Rhodoferax sp.]|uniref:peptide chain release factor N(5)-glutamine methyltransferase n=1 Tax=Rhodoferax sp. TaxID=50421 RepID=UPI00374D39D7